MVPIGVSTWLWHSPLDDAALAACARRVADWGFDVLELPVENPGDWDPDAARTVLDDCGLGATVCLVMPPGRELVDTDDATRTATQDYLRHVVDVAHTVGADAIGGPAYASVGRTWPMDDTQRADALAEWAEAIAPVADHARQAGVRIAVEPLNRYETSFLTTIDQALEAMAPLPVESVGVLLDTYHMNIEESDPVAAIHRAGDRIAHVQVCANDRGTPGHDHLDWPALLGALQEVGWSGPLCIESFTPDNETIATAASIWRPLAPTQDAIAVDGLAFLRGVVPGPP
ncbi:sugar phosphate isomerase/epimerase family protein [Salsipaludibacter albus]|uniref:sugar phosphate isomerase/epimerase family protein n=1 Tax=Salsipaludibacter albus TaxID=2849650 RepID=UPI001EE47C75|nr:sugar phosphate isomerase/epimerase family protein [Salsipaludibacter albus]MBY5163861.1 sugar phosphate isomerase/epimerase [Salsipaludibacter albus]